VVCGTCGSFNGLHITSKYIIVACTLLCTCVVGRDSSVDILTRYGLDGPGIESRWGRDFPHLSRLALGPTQPPIQWVPGLARG
jgi:hypothetical protein